MKYLRFALLVLVFLATTAAAQQTLTEDFEDEPLGTVTCPGPTEDFVTSWGFQTTCNQTAANDFSIVSGGIDGQSLKYNYNGVTGQHRIVAWTFEDLQYTEATLTYRQLSERNNFISFYQLGGGGDIGAIHYNTALDQICLGDNDFQMGCNVGGTVTLKTGVPTPWTFTLKSEFDFTAQSWTVTIVETGESATRAFQGSATRFDVLQIDPNTGAQAQSDNYMVDNIQLLSPLDPTEDVEPTFEPRPVEPGGIFGDNGAAFGGNKTALASELEISVTALEIGMAILWILLFMTIGFLSFNRSPMGALAGGVTGVVWSIAWGLIPLWFVFMLIILTAAGLLLLRRRA